MKKWKSENKGITLVALVVTIIILLILTGVTVYFAVNGGLLGKVEEAVNKSNTSGQNEANTLDEAGTVLDKYLNGNKSNIVEGSREDWDVSEDGRLGKFKGTVPADGTLVIPNVVDGIQIKKIQANETTSGTSPQDSILYNPDVFVAGSVYAAGVRKLVISEGIEEIGIGAFARTKDLESIQFPSTLKTIKGMAFVGCRELTTLVLPNGVTLLDNMVFSYCNNLTTVTIPSSLKSIGWECFMQCTSLTTVNYAGSQEQWDAMAMGSNNEPLINANIIYNYGK